MDALASSSDVFETFFESARIGLALADLSGRYVRVNRTYGELLGLSPEDLVGVTLAEVVGGLTGEDGHRLARLTSGKEQVLNSEAAHVLEDGSITWLLHGVATAPGADGTAGWFAVSAQDITERRRAEQELLALTDTLAERAVRDPLTGLANRTLLEERLRASLARDARSGGATGVLFLDLDGFKEINDRFGHRVGDEVLQAVAQRLRAVVRPSDTVARFGGDEFVVLVEQATPDALDALRPRVRAVVSQPLTVAGRAFEVGVSVGSAVATSGHADPQGLLAEADERMYAQKRTPR
jgi:diguanylate cyclase (GGDEF)-like protein/PAS domain S-box-containing protein